MSKNYNKSVRLNDEQMLKINEVMKLEKINISDAIKKFIDNDIIKINKNIYVVNDKIIAILFLFSSIIFCLFSVIIYINIVNFDKIFELISFLKIYNH